MEPWGPYPMAACPEFVGYAKNFSPLLYAAHGVHEVMDYKRLYSSVAVTPAPVRVPTLWPLVPSVTSVVG